LLEHGIVADALVVLDARAHNARFVRGLPAQTRLYLSTQCAGETFDAATPGAQIITWHAPMNGESGILETRPTYGVIGGMTVGVRSPHLLWLLGYREIHLFGMDSSFRGEAAHAYAQPENDADWVYECSVDHKDFHGTAWMIRQAEDLFNICLEFMSH